MKLGEPTLDQLRIFIAVAEHGSFGGAARASGRAISAISYGIAQLEAALALTLFDREGSRRPVLTAAGEGLLAEARSVADGVDALLAKARSLHAGQEPSLTLVIDVMMPGEVTAQVLGAFRQMFPTCALTLRIEGLGAVAACLIGGEADLAIGGPVIGDQPSLERQAVGAVDLIPVAAPFHPLARAGVAPGESRRHLQLVLTDRSPLTEGREFSVLSPLTWRLGDLGAKHALLKEGLGWGNMPRGMVAGDLASGALVELDLPEKPGAHYTLNALWRRDTRLGPAASWLVDSFRERLGC
ncbi:MAG: LysR family transcriptional regulator [Erythrobacter sp.]|jgi:DNA-binding transcriptional LysR family regulator|uniref:LysR family transcriptional regulator n=1 Tax=Erythrobacter sp. TaxID=1042 RepID=UPI002B47F9D2|nr:LysR family transcriptional regulator [Erythrobacter sp.]WRH71416.1 MAG: LysR family transcriptional regulator [Erythrobacter sp.]